MKKGTFHYTVTTLDQLGPDLDLDGVLIIRLHFYCNFNILFSFAIYYVFMFDHLTHSGPGLSV